MSTDEPGFEPQDPNEEERRANALEFIRHARAFVYSEADYKLLIALVHDGMSERAAPGERPRGQEG